MTPQSLALVLLLTYLAVTVVVDWLIKPLRREPFVLLVLALVLIWVYGPIVIKLGRG